jgi:3-dehydroquinate synthase
MKTITVPLAERSYDIEIAPGLIEHLASANWLDQYAEIAILTNEEVAPLYAKSLADQLQQNGRKVRLFAEPAGEQYKSAEWLQRAWDFLADFGLTRRGAIIAVGGGVVGDWAGFVAATWMRGVAFIQIPSTLLAMVDSSVGGKTGINHPRAKNLIGAFHQPQRVIIDINTLRTLPIRQIRAGLAEVIKYGVIADSDFFFWLENNIEKALALDESTLLHVIARSCEIKAEVVGEDERESDSVARRAILNYGHTVGHAIEATTEYGQLLHGEAIAIGMEVAARLAKLLDICEDIDDLIERQTKLFQRAGLPVVMPDKSTFDELWNAMTLDKKARGNQVNFVLPTKLGHVERVENVSRETVKSAINATSS